MYLLDGVGVVYNLSHLSRSTQVDEFAWAPNKVRMPGPPLHKYRRMCEIPFLGRGVLPLTEHHTVFGSARDETNEHKGDRSAHCWAMHREIWDRLLNDPSIHRTSASALTRSPTGRPSNSSALRSRYVPGQPRASGGARASPGSSSPSFLRPNTIASIRMICTRRSAGSTGRSAAPR